MAVAFRSSTHTGNDVFASSRAPAVPSGAAAGDIVVVFLSRWGGTNPAVTIPAGFTLKGTGVWSANNTARIDVFWKRLTGSDSGTYSFSWSGSMWCSAEVICFSGAITSGDPIDYNVWSGTAGSFGSISVTADTGAGLAWNAYNDTPAAGGHTPPSGFTETVDVDCGALAHRISTASGTQTASGASVTSSSPAAAVLLAVTPEPAGGVTHSGSVSLGVSSTLVAGAFLATRGSISLSATPSLSVNGTVTAVHAGSVSLISTPTLTVAGVRETSGTVQLSSTSTLTVGAFLGVEAAVSLTSTSTLSVAGLIERIGAVSLTTVQSLSTDGIVSKEGSVSLTAVPVLTASAIQEHFGTVSVTLSIDSSLSVSGLRTTFGAVSLPVAFTLTTNATGGSGGGAQLTSIYTLSISAPQIGAFGAVNLLPSYTLTVAARLGAFTAVSLAANSTLNVAVAGETGGAVSLGATPTLIVAAVRIRLGSVDLIVSVAIDVASTRIVAGSVSFVIGVTILAESTLGTANQVQLSVLPSLLVGGIKLTTGSVSLVAIATLQLVAGVGGWPPIISFGNIKTGTAFRSEVIPLIFLEVERINPSPNFGVITQSPHINIEIED